MFVPTRSKSKKMLLLGFRKVWGIGRKLGGARRNHLERNVY